MVGLVGLFAVTAISETCTDSTMPVMEQPMPRGGLVGFGGLFPDIAVFCGHYLHK